MITARAALKAVKGECIASVLVAEYRAHPTMIHQWREPMCVIGSSIMASALLEGAADRLSGAQISLKQPHNFPKWG